jgi:hypothetical protein
LRHSSRSAAQPGLGSSGSGAGAISDLGAAPGAVLPQLGSLPSDSVAPVPDAVANDVGEQVTAVFAPLTPRQLDLEVFYLMVLAGALTALGFGVLIQRSGLRTWVATRS